MNVWNQATLSTFQKTFSIPHLELFITMDNSQQLVNKFTSAWQWVNTDVGFEWTTYVDLLTSENVNQNGIFIHKSTPLIISEKKIFEKKEVNNITKRKAS